MKQFQGLERKEECRPQSTDFQSHHWCWLFAYQTKHSGKADLTWRRYGHSGNRNSKQWNRQRYTLCQQNSMQNGTRF
ncbi:hypothetical protein OCU04_006203 [Sclerotinia nivalis]|uniref:Uncharacterized protein n=1 Tax=Sclerotinia nivalis TaxID=352851 RepID=A0A9X0DJ61_9HELO|nr:hypothetical protein OCU04_006203 [Sclerotinia nivalis]